MRILYWSGLALILLGCGDDLPSTVQLDPALQSHLDQFVVEGLERGVEVDYEAMGLEARFDDLAEGVNGQCQHLSDNSNRVVLDRVYWSTATDTEREFLIFHELGHCVLDRAHLDDKSVQGDCRSIMHSNALACKNTYEASTRKLLLDELFSHE